MAGPKSDRESSESSFHPTARPLRMPYGPEQMNDTSGSRSTATDHDEEKIVSKAWRMQQLNPPANNVEEEETIKQSNRRRDGSRSSDNKRSRSSSRSRVGSDQVDDTGGTVHVYIRKSSRDGMGSMGGMSSGRRSPVVTTRSIASDDYGMAQMMMKVLIDPTIREALKAQKVVALIAQENHNTHWI